MENTVKLQDIQITGESTKFEIRPNAVPFGDYVAPLLFIWYCGSRNAASEDLNTIEEMFRAFLQWSGNSNADEIYNTVSVSAPKWKSLLIGAVKRNTSFLRTIEAAATNTYAQYSSRLPKTGKYYKKEDGTYTNVPHSTAFSSEESRLGTVCEMYFTLMKSGLIDYTASTGISAINLYTGEFYTSVPQQGSGVFQKILGIPTSGIFTVNKRPRGSYYQKTFTGVDAQCLASVGNVVSELSGLTSISWSIHRGKSTPRNLGKPAPAVRSRGSRTIAGTMIFTVADHHPLLDLVPSDEASFRKLELVNNQGQWRPIVLSDQLPPFDLTVVLTNEYGNSSILIIYGIDIVDEGSVLSTDNLLTEVTLQYVAVGMDPIQEVQGADVDGKIIIDPYGIAIGGGEQFFRRRETVMSGFGYDDYESAYDAYYRSILDLTRGR